MQRLEINTPGVVHESVDGEVVIVNLDSGMYFSTEGVGASLWALIDRGENSTDVVGWATATYGDPDGKITAEVERFFSDLVENKLVREIDESGHRADNDDAVPAPDDYRTPSLEMYSDMEELLLLDPVHEVSDDGWPNAAP